jgi:hypothetical protein
LERDQAIECLSRHRPRGQITAEDDQVRRLALDLTQNRFERRQVPVDVVEGGDPRNKKPRFRGFLEWA